MFRKEYCFIGRLRYYLLAASLAVVGVIVATVSWNTGIYPIMYIDGEGLTNAKVIAEYVIIAILLAAVISYYRLYKNHMDGFLRLIIITLVISIFSELSFTSYRSVYDTSNLLGHLFRFTSYVLIYWAIFLNNVKKPYLQLVIAREELAKTNTILEDKVREHLTKIADPPQFCSYFLIP